MNEILTELSRNVLTVQFNRRLMKNAMTSAMYVEFADQFLIEFAENHPHDLTHTNALHYCRASISTRSATRVTLHFRQANSVTASRP